MSETNLDHINPAWMSSGGLAGDLLRRSTLGRRCSLGHCCLGWSLLAGAGWAVLLAAGGDGGTERTVGVRGQRYKERLCSQIKSPKRVHVTCAYPTFRFIHYSFLSQ